MNWIWNGCCSNHGK